MAEEKKIKIYVISEDQYIQDYLILILVGENYDAKLFTRQEEVLTQLQKDMPDMIISDLNSAHNKGLELCKAIRKVPQFSYLPLLFILDSTGPEQLNKAKLIYAGADDYIQKASVEEELLLRVRLNLYRAARQQDMHPVTRLPGQPSLAKELQKRIAAKSQMGICCVDLCNFKDFNRRYGFRKGDEVLKYSSELILKALRDLGTSTDFLAHPQSDDFYFISIPETIEEISGRIIKEFDSGILAFYDEEDRTRGFMALKNRKGEMQQIPLLRIFIGIATNEHYPFVDPAQVLQIAAELKDFAQKSFEKSMYVKERRKEWPFS